MVLFGSLWLVGILCAGTDSTPAPECPESDCGPTTESGFSDFLDNLKAGAIDYAMAKFQFTQASFEHWFTDMTVQDLEIKMFRSTNTRVAYAIGQLDAEFLVELVKTTCTFTLNLQIFKLPDYSQNTKTKLRLKMRKYRLYRRQF